MRFSAGRRIFNVIVLLMFILSLFSFPTAPVSAEPVERPLALDTPPMISLLTPGSVLIGEDLDFTVTFNNNGDSPGYGPYIDVFIDRTGVDGIYPGTGLTDPTDLFDGLAAGGVNDFSVEYNGVSINSNDLFFIEFLPGTGSDSGRVVATHPLLRDLAGNYVTVYGDDYGYEAGDVLVVVRLPFGSFVPDQPAIDIDISTSMSNWADLGTPLSISARGGYQFGSTATDDWCCDNQLDLVSFPVTGNVIPTLVTFAKTNFASEAETATGPNFEQDYEISITVADGQTITDFNLVDELDDNVYYVGPLSFTGSSPSCTPPATSPGGTINCTYLSLSGTSTISFPFYIPRINSGLSDVLNPSTGDDSSSCNQAGGLGTWVSIDPRDIAEDDNVRVNLNIGDDGLESTCEDTLADKSITIQKSNTIAVNAGAAGASPSDIVRYTLNFQISDYFAFEDIVVTDVLSDGQHFYPGNPPTLSINGNSFDLTASAIAPENVDIVCKYTGALDDDTNCTELDLDSSGETRLVFNVSSEIISKGQLTGNMVGGCVEPTGTGVFPPNCNTSDSDGYNDGATTGTITYYASILENFTDVYPSGDPSVDQGDTLSNTVLVTGQLLDVSDLSSTANSELDNSASELSIARGSLTKSIYAINGETPEEPAKITVGDEVTYRIQYQLQTNDIENLVFTDYFPLPIFNVGATWAFDDTKNTGVTDVPAPGTVKLGSADTFYELYRTDPDLDPITGFGITSDIAANSVRVSFGDFDSSSDLNPKNIDLLFTVEVIDAQFADGLYFTNQAQVEESSTGLSPESASSIVQIQFTSPILTTSKSVVATDGNGTVTTDVMGVIWSAPTTAGVYPGARWAGDIADIDSVSNNIINADAGDLVTFAIVIQNTGSGISGAFDIDILDSLDLTYFEYPEPGDIHLQIYYGDGSGPIAYVGSIDDFIDDTSDALDAASGIRLVDPTPTEGVCQAHDPNSLNDTIVITYDLRLKSTVEAGEIYTNSGTIIHYAGQEGGTNLVPDPNPTDDSTVTISQPEISKSFISTGIITPGTNNDNTHAVIGEIVTYQLVVTVPEGTTPNAQIIDTMSAGLAFVDINSVVSDTNVESANLIGTGVTPANVTVSSTNGGTGNRLTFNFGTITNNNTNNGTDNTITIEYDTVVLNDINNQTNTTLGNIAYFTWGSDGSINDSSDQITVIEPDLSITKMAQRLLPTAGGASVDADDTVEYTISISNSSGVDAFDVTISDTFPSYLDPATLLITGVNDSGSILDTDDFDITGNVLSTLTNFDMLIANSRTVSLTITGVVIDTITPTRTITNTARVSWSSLDGDITDRSTYNTNSDERTGADGPGTGLNNYAKNSLAANVSVPALSGAKLFVTSSEAGTSNTSNPPRLTIGEIVRYRLYALVPEGLSTDLSLFDRLPNGLQFINDGQVKAAFVSTGTASNTFTSSTIDVSTNPTIEITGSAIDLISLPSGSIVFTLPDSAISRLPDSNDDTYGNGTDIYFKFGNISNLDDDADNEYIVVEFNALVLNVNGNQGYNNSNGASIDTNLDNNFQGIRNTSGTQIIDFTSSNMRTRIAEPAITNLSKSVSPSGGDAGNTVSYAVTFSNASGVNASPAYNVEFTDTVPAKMENVSLPPTVTSACAIGADPSASSGNAINVSFTELPVGCAVTIAYTAQLTTAVIPNEILTNSAKVTYTSLPGSNGTPSNPTGSANTGTPGDADGERIDGSTLNDYEDTDSVDVTVTPIQPVKSLVSSTDLNTIDPNLTIGETARFRMEILIGEGSSPIFIVTDNLPSGFEYTGNATMAFVASGNTITSDNADIGNSPWVIGDETTIDSITPTFDVPASAINAGPFTNGMDPVFNFSNLTNAETDTDDEFIVVEFDAVVLNVSGNQAVGPQTQLDNTFTVSIDSVNRGTSNTISTYVVEPQITTTKDVSLSSGMAYEAGSVVEYSLSYENTGSSTAYDVTVVDDLPPFLTYDDASISCTINGGSVDTTITPTLMDATDPAHDYYQLAINSQTEGDWGIPVGQSLDCTFTATIQTSVYTDATYTNTTDADWSSFDGTDNTEDRNYDGGSNGYDTGTDYNIDVDQDTDNAEFDILTPTIVKTVNKTDATIGEVVRYTITMTSPLGTLYDWVVTDSLPAGLIFAGNIIETGFDFPDPTISSPNDGTTAVTLEWDMSGAEVTSNTMSIAFDVIVANSVDGSSAYINVNGDDPNNNVEMAYTDISGSTQTISDDESFNVIEPELQVDKNFTPNPVGLGQTATYTINLSHTAASSTNAMDITITDVIPSGLTYEVATIGGSCTSGTLTPSDAGSPTLTWTVDNLPVGETCTLTYQVTVDDNSLGEILTNSVTGGYSTISGTPTPDEERDYTLSTDVDLEITGPDLSITKDDGVIETIPGSTLTYTLSYENHGNGPATGVVITETVPNNATFTTTGSTAGWSCSDGAGAGTTCTLPIGNLAAGATGSATFVVIVDSSVPADVTQIVNDVSIAGNETEPTPDDNPNSDSDTDTLTAAVDLTLTKIDDVADGDSVNPGDTIIYTLTYDNIGNRDATGVEIVDDVPANTTFTTTGSTAGWSCSPDSSAGSTCTFVIGDVDVNDPAGTVYFAVVVDDPLASGVTEILNAATIGGNETELVTTNNTDDETTPVIAEPNLTITKVADGTQIVTGGTIVYTITYDNNGDQTATGVVITETVPANTTFTTTGSDPRWSCSDGDVAGTECTVTIGTLSVGGGLSDPIAFAVVVNDTVPAGVENIYNLVEITDDGLNSEDGLPKTDNDDEETLLLAAPDLNIVKDDGVEIIQAGQNLTYTITYNNVGDQDATGVVITDTVPLFTTYNSEATPGWVCVPDETAGSLCTYTIGDLAAGATGQVSFAVDVDDPIDASIDEIYNFVTINDDGENGDDLTEDNQDDEITPVDALPDLTIIKNDRDVTAVPGDSIQYGLAYENVGQQNATGVVITETVPGYTTYDAVNSNPAWVCDDITAGSTCTFAVGDLNAGDSGSVLFAVLVENPLTAGVESILNNVSIEDDGTNGEDPTPENNVDDEETPVDAISDLTITKDDGVVQVTPGEELTYTIVVANVGTQSATGVVVTDTLPIGVVFVSASDGGVYDDNTREIIWNLGELAGGGEITLTVEISVEDPFTGVNPEIVNEVIVEDDGSNGVDPTPENNEDSDRDLIGDSAKVISGTNQIHTTGLDVAVGEVVTYTVTLDIAPGLVEDLVFTDILDQGMAFVGCNQITTDPADVLTLEPGYTLSGLCTMAAISQYPVTSTNVTDSGRQMIINFGDVTNISAAEEDITLTIEYDVVVLNTEANVDGQTLGNQADWTWVGGSLEAEASPVTIVEPDLVITKSVTPETAYNNQTVTFTVTLNHTEDSNSDAFNLAISDTLPETLTYVPGSLVFVSGQVPTLINDLNAPILRVGWDIFTQTTEPTVLSYQARITKANPGSKIENTVTMEWTSLPGDVLTPQSPYNQTSVERSYTPGSNVDVYGVSANALINIPQLPDTGFAPGVRTILPQQPENLVYQAIDDLRFAIPKQNLDLPIVGVPLATDGWDLTWLSSQVGYLEGTAYPTWDGNTGLTAHVYNADGTPGPFVNLHLLRWGDKVEVTAFGQVFTYEVRSVERVSPNDLSVLHHEDRSWLTLITCQSFDETKGSYTWRVVVRAVLVSVEPIN
ncbi:MAG: hypothetical protein CL609_05985 [Anaerolineaceae bacterium]|nr:hypothetical protein [Anaerolineaceae bacterium]